MKADHPHSKLFSFREWQRFIECRRNILMQKHFPTKFKNDSDGFGNTELYVKFIKSALSRREEKPEITNYKNMIPRDLTNAMEQCIAKLGESCENSDYVEIFPSSLTPHYSYLEQLLENPMYDLPDILRSDFNNAKTFYSTMAEKFIKFAAKYGIELKAVKSRLHFVDKLVPPFERSKMPSMTEWNASVTISNCSKERVEESTVSLERQGSQRFDLNRVSQSYYDAIQERLRTDNKNEETPEEDVSVKHVGLKKSDEDDFDFGFEEVTCEGKLAVSYHHDLDSDDESVVDITQQNSSRDGTEGLTFYQKYNLQIPDSRGDSKRGLVAENKNQELTRNFNGRFIAKNQNKNKNQELTRDSNGRFVAKDSAKARREPVVYKTPRKVRPYLKNLEDRHPPSQNNSTLESRDESLDSSIVSDISEKLFIPSEDYWMYHCVFSRVKPKNFEFFESELPNSFQWLLNECADVIETSTEDLYEQVCLVETYFAHILRPFDSRRDSDVVKDNQAKIRICKKKW